MKFNHTAFFNNYKGVYGKINQVQVSGLDNLLGYIELDPEITDLRQAAYMLATVKHECADKFQPITEMGGRAYFNKYEPGTKIGRGLGNTVAGDGFLFRGRGYVQLTGRTNYQNMSMVLALGPDDDLVAHPDYTLHPEMAYRIMSYGMRNGTFTSKRLNDYINSSVCDYKNARRIINGLDRAALIAGYAVNFETFLSNSMVA